MSLAADTYLELFKTAAASQEVAMVKEALDPKTLAWLLGGGAAAGLGLGLPLAYRAGKNSGEEGAAGDRVTAFGAGAAAGLAAPYVISGLKRSVGLGLSPNTSGEFTEF